MVYIFPKTLEMSLPFAHLKDPLVSWTWYTQESPHCWAISGHPNMGRGQGNGKQKGKGKGKGNGPAKGRNIFLDPPSPLRPIQSPPADPQETEQSVPSPQNQLNLEDISWGSDLSDPPDPSPAQDNESLDPSPAQDNESPPHTPLTDPYGNPTLLNIITDFLREGRNANRNQSPGSSTPPSTPSRLGSISESSSTSSLHSSFFRASANLSSQNSLLDRATNVKKRRKGLNL